MCQRLSDEHEQNQHTCKLSTAVIAKTPALALMSVGDVPEHAKPFPGLALVCSALRLGSSTLAGLYTFMGRKSSPVGYHT